MSYIFQQAILVGRIVWLCESTPGLASCLDEPTKRSGDKIWKKATTDEYTQEVGGLWEDRRVLEPMVDQQALTIARLRNFNMFEFEGQHYSSAAEAALEVAKRLLCEILVAIRFYSGDESILAYVPRHRETPGALLKPWDSGLGHKLREHLPAVCRHLETDVLPIPVSKLFVGCQQEEHLLQSGGSPGTVQVEWSMPNSPTQWAKVFGWSYSTMLRRLEDQKIRNKKLSKRSYQIALDDLPTRHKDAHRLPG